VSPRPLVATWISDTRDCNSTLLWVEAIQAPHASYAAYWIAAVHMPLKPCTFPTTVPSSKDFSYTHYAPLLPPRNHPHTIISAIMQSITTLEGYNHLRIMTNHWNERYFKSFVKSSAAAGSCNYLIWCWSRIKKDVPRSQLTFLKRSQVREDQS